MKSLVKKLTAVIAAAAAASALASCARENAAEPEPSPVSASQGAYAFIGKDIQNTYMQKLYEGFETACGEIGVKAVYRTPETATAEKQIDIIHSLISEGVDGIAIAANDRDALQSELRAAMEAGIKVVSLDSAVNKESRQVHVQQADPEKIGRELIRAAYEICGGSGAAAILSSTQDATNQNLWIEYMKKEYEENADKYASMPLKYIVYGDDDVTKSISETQTLLADSDIKVIIAPTTVGMKAAGRLISETGSDVKLTGLGLPSEMAEYIESGICPYMYLWNPVDIGYLAGFTLNSLVNRQISGTEGETFEAGSMGSRTISVDTDGGTEVILGDLLRFDSSNIDRWKVLY